MKTAKRSIVLLTALFVLAACSESLHDEVPQRINKEVWRNYEKNLTKSIDTRLAANGVSEEDVRNYLHYAMQIPANEVKDITRYDIDEDVYIYIVNLVDGRWYFFSGDYSSGPIVGGGETDGFYPNNDMSSHMAKWLKSIRNYIIDNRAEDANRAAQVQDNRNKWIRAQRISDLKAGIPSSLFVSGDPEPDTMEVDVQLITDTLIFENYPSLTVTQWNQSYPWNGAMPKLDLQGVEDRRSHAGCAVIAIAQLLYYTHYAFGYPNDIYSEAVCNTTIDTKMTAPVKPVWNFSNPSSTCWDLMSLVYDSRTDDLDTYTPALCAWIAHISDTRYGFEDGFPGFDWSYGATAPDTIPGTLNFFMLSGSYRKGYSVADVSNEIKQNRPVLCSGRDTPGTSTGHIFLIDGYYMLRVLHGERFLDMEGNYLWENTYTEDLSYWRVNTGDGPGRINVPITENTYYPYNREIFIGWR